MENEELQELLDNLSDLDATLEEKSVEELIDLLSDVEEKEEEQ